LAEVAEYVGWQLYNPNDTSGAIKAALLLRHLLENIPLFSTICHDGEAAVHCLACWDSWLKDS